MGCLHPLMRVGSLTMRKSILKFAVLKANRSPVPASFFGMILGLVGLGNCWRVAAKIWHLPAWIGEAHYAACDRNLARVAAALCQQMAVGARRGAG